MTVEVRLREHSTVWNGELTFDDVRALQATGAVTVVPAASGWNITAGSIVGLVELGSVKLHIDPKVPIRNLLYLLHHGSDEDGWRADSAQLEHTDDLYELVARAFITYTDRALLPGPLRGYVSRDVTSSVLRGRLRVGDQLASRAGLAAPLEIAYDEYTTDIAENAIVVAAVERLQRGHQLPVALRGPLSRLRRDLDAVTPWPAGLPLPQVPLDRINARYGPALRLARLILEHTALGATGGPSRGTGMLFDMNRVFEDFLTRRFAAVATGQHRLSGQHVTALDESSQALIRPDLTWWDGARCIAVADAKYKDLRQRSVPNEDLYQVLTYIDVLGLPEGHLIYGAGLGPTRTYRVRGIGRTLHVHHLDLSADLESLSAEVRELSEAIALGAAASASVRVN